MSEKDPLKEIVRTGHGMARFLVENGVYYVFGIPDGHTLGFYDGMLQNEGIKHILFNDERSAAFAADAYARVTGMIGVCDAGAAGSMNFPVALSEAKGFGSPVMAIVGVIKSKDVLRNIPHDINVAETLEPVTKWTSKVLDAEYLPRFMNFALKKATNGKPGPVALVIAEDVIAEKSLKLEEFVPRVKGSCSINSCRTAPPAVEVNQAIKMIRESKQPAIFAGGGAVESGAFTEVETLSQMLNAPVFSTISGKGIMVSNPDPKKNLYFGTVGLFGEKPNNKFIRLKADLVIAVGNRLTEDDTANFKYPSSRTKMIQIDIDPAEIGLSYHPWGIVGDPKATLFEIIDKLKDKKLTNFNKDEIYAERQENIKWLSDKLEKYWEKDRKKWMNAEPIKPQRILKAISDNLTKDDYLVTDASASARFIGAYYPVKSIGRKIITPRGVGPTGFGVGALIGTCIAADHYNNKGKNPKKVLFTGDGGLMNGGINEFETLSKLNLDCTIVIMNNSALGFVKFGQFFLYRKRIYQTDRPHTNFAKIAKGFDIEGTTVEELEALDPAIKEAINSPGPNLVDVKIDPMEFLPPNSY